MVVKSALEEAIDFKQKADDLKHQIRIAEEIKVNQLNEIFIAQEQQSKAAHELT